MTFEPEQLGQSGQELASMLRDLRKRAGLSGVRLAARCNMSQSKVSRIESGKVRPSLVDVEQILRALDAPPSMVAEVSALARMANTEWRNLRELRRKGLGTRQAKLKALEASSTHMRYFLLSMVTGLLAGRGESGSDGGSRQGARRRAVTAGRSGAPGAAGALSGGRPG